MITKINKLKNFGIFQNYIHDNSLADFKQYNLFYGWNGSGKSTLVDLFRWIETKQPINFLDSEWEVTSEANTINQSNVTSNVLNLKVFNKDFVEKNVFTENGVKGIVYLSEKVGTDKIKLDAEEVILKEQEKLNMMNTFQKNQRKLSTKSTKY
ncbi:MAG: hypothetical protein AUK44_07105 [Porphyromonadaceae bacterium CG2_30_38_12]|nr:MAG: hypothetical protein AUK44_07105 [Porphyromonadaceae bacterium CG2_30_38_12]